MHPRQSFIRFKVLFAFGSSCTFTSYVPYLIDLGLSPADVSLINVWFWGAIMACELPTGVFADRVSRMTSVRLGVSITVLGSLLYATATGFYTALLYEVLLGIGGAFISGALSAWLRDALGKRGESKLFASTIAMGTQYQSLSVLVGGVLGGFLSMWSYRMTWVVSSLLVFAALLVTVREMHEERVAEVIRPDPSRSRIMQMFWQDIRSCGKILWTRAGLGWAALAAIAFQLVLPFNHYWAPFVTSHVGDVGRTLLWIPMHATLAGSAWFVRRFLQSTKYEFAGIVIAMTSAGAGMVLMGYLPGNVLPMIGLMVHEVGRGAFEPTIDPFIQNRVDSAHRATYGSLQSLLTRIGSVGILGIITVWTYGQNWDMAMITKVWIVMGGLLVLIALLLWMHRPRLSNRRVEEPDVEME